MRYLILGSGPAGIAAAKAVRNMEQDADVVIATEELVPPYLRPCLPDLISGEMEPAAVADPQGKSLAAEKIEIRQGKRARRVDAAKNRVAFSDGTEETYNFLLVATGGRPILPLALMGNPGSFLPLNSLGDALRIRARAMRADVSLVFGPGYLGIEATRALRKLGQQVIWVNPGLPRFGNPISGEVEAKVTARLRNNGVQIKEGTDIADVLDLDGTTYIVYTAGGEEIRCQMIVAATERLPAIGFLEGSGVKVGAGILVDEYLRTNVSNIFAAGDCAEVFDINRRESRINFGWRSALKQGQLAGENLAGGGKLFIRNTEDYFGLLYGTSLLERTR
jgi:NADPH-dependent 2,4-dienoyl-CoA reductase/sulfur reductase-like enzyme